MVDSSDEDRGDGHTQTCCLNVFNVKSSCNFGHDTMPGTSNAIGAANDIKMENATFYDLVCTTMKKIEDARTCEKSTDTGKKRPNPHRTSAVPRKKSHDGEMYAGKLSNLGGDLKTARPRRKERKNVKKRERALSSESESSSRSESSR